MVYGGPVIPISVVRAFNKSKSKFTVVDEGFAWVKAVNETVATIPEPDVDPLKLPSE